MSILAIEGVVDRGTIRVVGEVCLPEGARVYVIVPEPAPEKTPKLPSPRLANRQDVPDFAMRIVEQDADAEL